MVGVAVNVSEFPVQVGFVPVVTAMLTEGVTVGFTTIVIALELAVVAVTHPPETDRVQVMTSFVTNVELT